MFVKAKMIFGLSFAAVILMSAAGPWGSQARGAEPIVVAVFLMESRGSNLSADEVVGLTDFLAARLGEGGRFQIVPRDELQKRLKAAKRASQKECFDSSCQIELGRELAASFSISSGISRVGSQCLVTASVWDLRRATQVQSAGMRSACKAEVLIDAVDMIAVKLDAAMSGKPMPKGRVVSAPQAAPAPVVAKVTPAVRVETRPPAVVPNSGPATSKHLALAKNVFNPDEVIEVRWFKTTGGHNDWVDVVPEGTGDDEAGSYLDYLRRVDGSFRVADLKPGRYNARLYQNYDRVGYQVSDRLAFQVVAPDRSPGGLAVKSTKLGLAKSVFAASEAIQVHYFNSNGSRYDWVGVVPKGHPDNDAGGSYGYLEAAEGSYTVEAGTLSAGDYEARIYQDYNSKGYNVADRLPFSVR